MLGIATGGCRGISPESVSQNADMSTPAQALGLPRTTSGSSEARESRRAGHVNETPGAIQMTPVRVAENRFSKFGISVATDNEAPREGRIRWIRIVAVDKDLERTLDISVGQRILAIDGVEVTKLTRFEVFRMITEKPGGAQIRLLVLSPSSGLPRFVTLKDMPPNPKLLSDPPRSRW
ncbi:MAG: hypothetical protein V4773_23165 [Verrucomicrobiota bacterium]